MNDLERFTSALRDRTQRLRRAEQPLPDVADTVDRAIAMDPDAVAPGLRVAVEGEDHGPAEAEVAAADVDVFARALRRRTERAAEDRRLDALPAAPRRDNARRWLWAGAVAAAAVVALAASAMQGTWMTTTERSEGPSAAERLVSDPPAAEGQAHTRTPQRGHGNAAPPDNPEGADSTPAPDSAEALEPSAPPRPQASLDALEARAKEAWEAGDLAAAEKAFRAIVRRAGRSRRAELAFADLFVVVERRGGPNARARVWKEYLRRFPRGRFADDIAAGLCRRETGPKRTSCWQRYLDKRADGTHAREAREVLSKSSSTPQ